MTTLAQNGLEMLALAVEVMAGLVVGAAVLQSAVRLSACLVRPLQAPGIVAEARLTLGRWLSMALELAVAADILRTAIAPGWNAIGQLAAIAALRTALNYFLARDLTAGEAVSR
jgi:uncharacterized membrane protein